MRMKELAAMVTQVFHSWMGSHAKCLGQGVLTQAPRQEDESPLNDSIYLSNMFDENKITIQQTFPLHKL